MDQEDGFLDYQIGNLNLSKCNVSNNLDESFFSFESIYFQLNCSVLPSVVAGLIFGFNLMILFLQYFVKKIKWEGFINYHWIILVPAIIISIVIYPVKNQIILTSIQDFNIAFFQACIQTLYDSIILSMITIHIDLILTNLNPKLTDDKYYPFIIRTMLIFFWFGDLLINYKLLTLINENQLISSFSLNSFPVPSQFLAFLSFLLGLINIFMACVSHFAIIFRQKNSEYFVLPNTTYFMPHLLITFLLIFSRLFPQIFLSVFLTIFTANQNGGAHPAATAVVSLQFMEWFGLILPPLIMLFDCSNYKYIKETLRGSEYQSI